MYTAAVGIDISKDTLDIAMIIEETGTTVVHQIDNAKRKIKTLRTWFKRQQVSQLHACLESTGTYGDAVAEFLHAEGHTVSVLNPAQAKSYSDMWDKRTNTDKVDAALLAHLCASHKSKLVVWQPLSPEMKELKQLASARKALVKDRTRFQNRLQASELYPSLKTEYNRILKHLKQGIVSITAKMHALIAQYEPIKRLYELLLSIPGIGKVTAASLIPEIGDINRFEKAEQLVCFAGLVPVHKKSGTSVSTSKPMSKKGKKSLRTMMFYPALSAKRHQPSMKAFAEKLEKAGKAKMVIIGAVMRKLMRLVYGVLKSGIPFDPNHRQNQPILT